MRIVTELNERKIYELEDYNNLADRPTAFVNFISRLCKKYELIISKLAKCNDEERNLGVELLGVDTLIQFFYEYNINTLELMISTNYNEVLKKQMENDIFEYINTINFKKGDEVFDEYGKEYILKEDVIFSPRLKSYKALVLSTGEEAKVFCGHIYPKLKF